MSILPSSAPSQAYIDGRSVDAESGDTLDVVAPGRGTVVASVADCGEVDVARAASSARRAFEAGVWRDRSPQERKAVLQRFAGLMEEDARDLALMDSVSAGKPITDCLDGDVPDSVDTLRWYAEIADKLYDKMAPADASSLALVTREPIGVVAAVLPWNFPCTMAAIKLGPALVAGNSVIVKPAKQTPFSAIRMAQLASEAGLPDGVLNVVPGRGEVAGRVLGLSGDVDAVTFTGSTEVGRGFLKYAASSNLKRVMLECGGKSPQIILDMRDDLEYVAGQLADAAFHNSGQNCTAGSRILVERSIHREVVDALAAAASDLVVGDPLDPATQLGAIIDGEALRRILGYVTDAERAGARVVCGGRRILEETGGWFIGPTILDGVTPDMAVAREEIFGPVVSIVAFETEEEAVRLANDSEYGLAASVYSSDLERAYRVARRVRAGTVSINCYREGDATVPFGGYKTSGFGGRDLGIEALDQFTEVKTILAELR